MEKTEQQKKAVIISAEGDSKATELIANSFHTAGDGLIGLRKLEATVDIVYRVSHSRNTAYLLARQMVLFQLTQGGLPCLHLLGPCGPQP